MTDYEEFIKQQAISFGMEFKKDAMGSLFLKYKERLLEISTSAYLAMFPHEEYETTQTFYVDELPDCTPITENETFTVPAQTDEDIKNQIVATLRYFKLQTDTIIETGGTPC
jgi:hypothetical protein